MKKIVIKIGSRVLTGEDGFLDENIISRLSQDVAKVKAGGVEAVIVSSGAVSAGKSIINLEGKMMNEAIKYNKEILKEQILASIGQGALIAAYVREMKKYNIICSQILTTRRDYVDREEYLSLRTVTENLLRLGVIPIFNENDVLSPAELDFSDNDQLAYMIAAMIGADLLVILTNVDGVFNGPLDDDKSAVIPVIEDIASFMDKIDDSGSKGKGGMKSKLYSAELITSLGIPMQIANGLEKDVISRIVAGEQVGTHFPSKVKKAKPFKNWLLTSAAGEGKKIIVSTFLADILKNKKAASILFTGIEKIEGDFKKGDAVTICDDEGTILGKGVSKYSSQDLIEEVARYKSMSDSEKGRMRTAEVIAVHYNYFVFV